MSQISELDAHLDALKTKVTKSRISAVTTLCVENVKDESEIVYKLTGHLQRSQPQQKLGVLYVVDSVIRQWMDRANAAGQDPSAPQPQNGTFAGGIRRLRDILPVMMADVIQCAPDDQKDKISKLIEIWERGSVFPSSMLATFRSSMAARNQPALISAPVPQGIPATAQVVANTSVAHVAQLPSAPPPTLNGNSNSPSAHYTAPQAVQAQQYANVQPSTPAIPAPAPAAPGVVAPEVATALAAIVPAEVLADPARLPAYLQVLQYLVSNGIPPTQWAQVMQAFHAQATGAAAVQPQAPVQPPPQVQPVIQPVQPPAPIAQSYQPFQSQPVAATPPVPVTRRSRSRSPPRRRGSPVYDTYQSGNNNGNGYRQRSPLRETNPAQSDFISVANSGGTGEKWTSIDPTLPKGNIKVLSRTLFVGGVACSDQELHRIFSRFGLVQSAIVNNEKRHAFVKMCNRNEAVAARDGMENMTDPDVTSKVRKTRWGVGFGPRECNNYETGISIIPLDRLTDADRKWALSAEYGGTGGKPLVDQMVMEEPDIEIGAGVSSKAISARRTTRDDRGGRRGQGNSPAQRGRNTSGGGGGMNDRRFQNNNNNQQQNYQNSNNQQNYQNNNNNNNSNNNQNMGAPTQGYGQMSGGMNGAGNSGNGMPGFNGAAMPSAANLMQMMGFMNAQGMNFGGPQGQGGQSGQGGQGYR